MRHREAVTAIITRVMRDRVKILEDQARSQVTETIGPGDKHTARLPDGTRIGQVWVTDPQPPDPRRVVTDEAEFTAWVQATRPDEIEIVTRVRPHTVAAILAQPPADDNGEVIDVPGTEWLAPPAGEPRLTVKPDDGAEAAIMAALGAGDLVLDGGIPALPPGVSDA